MGIIREVKTEVYCDICGEYVIGWRSTEHSVSKGWAAYFARQEGCTTGEKVVCKECRIRRRIEKCSLQKKYGEAERDGDGTCLGFGSGYDRQFDDEPIEQCKRCIACTSFDWEKELYEKSFDGRRERSRYGNE